jgi:NAD(P)-dependent dehydrogenase (short-subunit alcohol dehydrogenase family)
MKPPHSLNIGGTRGLGRELVDHFVDESHKVSVVPRRLPERRAAPPQVRYWAVTLGRRGIRVNSVSPGTVLKAESKRFFVGDKQLSELYRRITPLGRFGHAREVAQVIGCLCSEATSFVTGREIVVDDGVSLQWPESLPREFLDIGSAPTRRATHKRTK